MNDYNLKSLIVLTELLRDRPNKVLLLCMRGDWLPSFDKVSSLPQCVCVCCIQSMVCWYLYIRGFHGISPVTS